MTSKKSRAPTALKLNLLDLKLIKGKSKSDTCHTMYPSLLETKEKPLIVDQNMIVTSLALANDTNFLLNNNVTHVINCVSNNFPSNQVGTISYLHLSMRDSMDQDLLEPVTESLNFINEAKTASPICKILVHC